MFVLPIVYRDNNMFGLTIVYIHTVEFPINPRHKIQMIVIFLSVEF